MNKLTTKLMIPLLTMSFAFSAQHAVAGPQEDLKLRAFELETDRDENKVQILDTTLRIKTLESLSSPGLVSYYHQHYRDILGLTVTAEFTVGGFAFLLGKNRILAGSFIAGLLTTSIGAGMWPTSDYTTYFEMYRSLPESQRIELHKTFMNELADLGRKQAEIKKSIIETRKALEGQLDDLAQKKSDVKKSLSDIAD